MMNLLEDEELAFELKPHFLSQWKVGFFWFVVLFFSLFCLYGRVAFFAYLQHIIENDSGRLMEVLTKANLTKAGVLGVLNFIQQLPPDLFWCLFVLPMAVITAFVKISFRPLLTIVVCVLLMMFVSYKWPEVPSLVPRAGLLTACLMLLKLEYDRVSTRYILTDKRLVFVRGSFGLNSRTVFYSKIDDLFLNQSLLGKILGYGTIIPVTSSQIGTGSVHSFVGTSASTSAKGGGLALGTTLGTGFVQGRKTIKESLEFTLYCVPHVEKAYDYMVMRISDGGK